MPSINTLNIDEIRRALYESLMNVINDARALRKIECAPRYATEDDIVRAELLLRGLRA
jgi:hypothetical protein